ncbi:MAG: XRE family transcriptional regulator [Acidobacteriota bacterium]
MLSTEALAERIVTIRNERGLTQADLQNGADLSRADLIAIEKGEVRPEPAVLINLAKLLEVDVHDLLAEHRARAETTPRFRLARQVGLRDARRSVERVTALARKFVELERVLAIRRPRAPLEALETYRVSGRRRGLDPRLAGEHAAGSVRSILGLGNGPAVGLNERLEVEAGLRIFYIDELPASVAGLLIWTEELGACIGVNRSQSHGQRRWSLSYEVGHFLRDREEGNILPTTPRKRPNASQVFADAFARSFLLPRPSVSKQFSDRCRANGGRFGVADILWMADLYEVTFSLMTRRLEELSFFPKDTYRRLTAERFRPSQPHRIRESPRAERNAPSRFPVHYITLALEAYERGLITERALADYLDVDRARARDLHHRWSFQPVGEHHEVELRLDQNIVTLS